MENFLACCVMHVTLWINQITLIAQITTKVVALSPSRNVLEAFSTNSIDADQTASEAV